MNGAKYKYNINHRISLLPREIGVGEAAAMLERGCGISRACFDDDRNLRAGSTETIPRSRLAIYAQFFKCTVADLKHRSGKQRLAQFLKAFTTPR